MSDFTTPRFSYPATQKVDQVDNYHGTLVADPYRWLEDENSTDVQKWIQDQNQLTFDYLDSLPTREAVRERITELWNYSRRSLPVQRNGTYFYSSNDGLQNQPIFYRQISSDADPEVILDPNSFSEDGTIALTFVKISRNARYVGYGIADGGSDWQTIRVRDLKTGLDLDDRIEWVKFSLIEWTHDNNGFFIAVTLLPMRSER